MAAMTHEQTNAANRGGTGVVNAAKDIAGKVGDEVKGAASSVTQAASDAASYMGKQAGGAVSAISDTIKSGENYLEEKGFEGVVTDLTSLVRRNPIPSVLIALGMGFLVARATRG